MAVYGTDVYGTGTYGADTVSNASNIGITANDFINNPLTDFGVDVSWEVATKTLDPISGDETLSYGTASNVQVVFVKRAQRYQQTHEGLVDLGDAIMHTRTTTGVVKDDRITYEGEIFIVVSVIRRRADGEDMLDTCTLNKIED